MIPYEGRYDAMQPSLFVFDKAGKKFLVTAAIPSLDGEVRDIKRMKYAGGKEMLVLARNNNGLQFYKTAD